MLSIVALCLLGFGPEEDAKAALVLAALKEAAAPKPRVPDPPPIPPPAPTVIKIPATIPTTVTIYRNPVGHTHTCPRCGTTWDHASNPGHNCPACGTSQYVQDRSPRPVAVKKVVNVPAPPTVAPAAPRPQVQPSQNWQDIQRLMQQSRAAPAAGCPTGG